MMRRSGNGKGWWSGLMLASVAAVSLAIGWGGEPARRAGAQPPARGKVAAEPVEADPHEFMEYLFEPAYKRVKQALAEGPSENATWKAIKSDALILAEGGNLLLLRVPDEQAAAWQRHAVAVRSEGKRLYEAARQKDVETSGQAFRALLQQCNRCHDDFADGEHQLAP